jgi:hypothetical protein
MARRRFSVAPKIGTGSRASKRTIRGELPADVQKFKNTYVFERGVLQRFREGVDASGYSPSPSLDGKSRWNTAEEKTNIVSAWESAYAKLNKAQKFTDPCKFVRILFHILRGSSVSIPTVSQLSTPNMLELVGEFLQDKGL